MLFARKLADYRLDTHVDSARGHHNCDITAHDENVGGYVNGFHKACDRCDKHVPDALRIFFGRSIGAGDRLKLFSSRVDVFISACRDNPRHHSYKGNNCKKGCVAGWHFQFFHRHYLLIASCPYIVIIL